MDEKLAYLAEQGSLLQAREARKCLHTGYHLVGYTFLLRLILSRAHSLCPMKCNQRDQYSA